MSATWRFTLAIVANDPRQDAPRIRKRANKDHWDSARSGHAGDIHLRCGRLPEALVLDVLDHADDLERSLTGQSRRQSHRRADRIGALEIRGHERLIHDDGGWRLSRGPSREAAAANDTKPEGPEIIRRAELNDRRWWGGSLVSVKPQFNPEGIAERRNRGRRRSRLNAWNSRDALECLLKEAFLLDRIRVRTGRKGDGHEEDVLGVEPRSIRMIDTNERINRPALSSSTSDSAISAATSPLRR